MESAYWHALYDNTLYKSMHDNNCLPQYYEFYDPKQITKVCQDNIVDFYNLVSNVNIYDVYGICYTSTSAKTKSS